MAKVATQGPRDFLALLGSLLQSQKEEAPRELGPPGHAALIWSRSIVHIDGVYPILPPAIHCRSQQHLRRATALLQDVPGPKRPIAANHSRVVSPRHRALDPQVFMRLAHRRRPQARVSLLTRKFFQIREEAEFKDLIETATAAQVGSGQISGGGRSPCGAWRAVMRCDCPVCLDAHELPPLSPEFLTNNRLTDAWLCDDSPLRAH